MLEWNPRLLMMELVTSSFVCFGHYILVRLKKKPKSYVKNINWEKKMLEVKEEDTHNASDAIIIITMKRHLFWTTFFILILIFFFSETCFSWQESEREWTTTSLGGQRQLLNAWKNCSVSGTEQNPTPPKKTISLKRREDVITRWGTNNLSMNGCWRREEGEITGSWKFNHSPEVPEESFL